MAQPVIRVTLNAGYVMFTISLMHRRLLPTEKWFWYRRGRRRAAGRRDWNPRRSAAKLFPEHLGRIGEIGALLASSAFVSFPRPLWQLRQCARPKSRATSLQLTEPFASRVGVDIKRVF